MGKSVVPRAKLDTLHDMPLPTRPRLTWIDLLRGVAVIGMIETHVMNTVLSAEFDGAEWRHQLSFYNGLLAPAFLWIAGFVQGLSIRKAQGEGRPVATMARLRRLGFVGLLGYVLHVPWDRWLAGDFGVESWRIALQADILQSMAVSLTLLLLAGTARGGWLDVITGLLAAGFVFAAPAAQHWHTGVVGIDAFLNHNNGSLFPLFPWVAFCAAGCLMSRWEVSWKTLVPTSLIFITLGMFLVPETYSYVHPSFFAERLGWLGLLITAVWLAGQKFAPAWLQLAGRESLFIYVMHLLLLHSIPFRGTTLNLWIGHTLTPIVTVLVFFAVLGICLALAWANERRKQRAKAS